MKISLVTHALTIRTSIIHAIEGARFAMKSNEMYGDSYYSTSFVNDYIGKKDMQLALGLSGNTPACGHDKFLQSIPLLVDITMSRSMWQEFDTYRIGVSKQSESTMHTITKDNFSFEDFELDENLVASGYVVVQGLAMVDYFLELKKNIDRDYEENVINETVYRESLKKILPECFLQKRRVSLNYAVLKTMYHQRKNHKNKEWIRFLDYMKKETPHSELWVEKQKEEVG